MMGWNEVACASEGNQSGLTELVDGGVDVGVGVVGEYRGNFVVGGGVFAGRGE